MALWHLGFTWKGDKLFPRSAQITCEKKKKLNFICSISSEWYVTAVCVALPEAICLIRCNS
jgi:hypothetical protein